MSRVVVIGAGVVGQSYAALLTRAGHEVVIVARGDRATHISRDGLRVRLDGAQLDTPCEVVPHAELAGSIDAAVFAVRGEQLESVLDQVERCSSPLVIGLTNPLGRMDAAASRIGRDRLVWGFSGLGGQYREGAVTAHLVRQQPTVLESGAARSAQAIELFGSLGIPLDQEPEISDWFDTHNVFIAGMAAAILAHPEGAAHTAGSWTSAAKLVRAMRDGFDALEAKGTRVRPRPLRMIFGRVPTPIAAAYWKRQFATPMATLSMEPHARATRDTEMVAVFDHALSLVEDRAPRYRAFIQRTMGGPADITVG